MKKLFCLVLACLFIASIGWAKEKVKPQKFNVTITIEYDDLSIQQLADVEKELSDIFKDAKSIRYSFQKETPLNYREYGVTLTPNTLEVIR